MLEINKVNAGYGHTQIVTEADFRVEDGKISSIIGPNGCGKSTLLKTIEGHLDAMGGSILVDGRTLEDYTPKNLAKKLGCLNQTNVSPSDMTVERLVRYGRVPYHKFGLPTDPEKDNQAVELAMESTGILPYRKRLLTSLSGGERQKVWIALALAQEPKYLLLDEPTTYLDICHQLEVLELLRHLNREHGITIIMVIHDLNQAVQYSDRIIMMKKGHIMAVGNPEEVICPDSLREVFSLECEIMHDSRKNMIIVPTGFSDNSFLSYLEDNNHGPEN